MGHNRAGENRKRRKKRRLREDERNHARMVNKLRILADQEPILPIKEAVRKLRK